MEAKVIRVSGVTFIGKAQSNHWIPMDGPEKFEGYNAATRPKELILIALGGCSGSDVASILLKMHQDVKRMEVDISADTAEEHPKIFTAIRLNYRFWGNELNPEKIEKAIHLSHDRYCSVTAMLKKTVDISFTFEINT